MMRAARELKRNGLPAEERRVKIVSASALNGKLGRCISTLDPSGGLS
jgi:hypothetical protein